MEADALRAALREAPREGGQCHPVSLVLPKARLRLEADALRASLTEVIRW